MSMTVITRIDGLSARQYVGQRAHDLRVEEEDIGDEQEAQEAPSKRRHLVPDYVDSTRSHLNTVFIPEPDVPDHEGLHALNEGLKIAAKERTAAAYAAAKASGDEEATKAAWKAKQACRQRYKRTDIAAYAVYIGFGAEAQPIFEALDPAEQDRLFQEAIEAVRQDMGAELVSAVVHRDEYTPHLQLLFTAVTTAGAKVRYKPDDCSRLQDIAAQPFAHLGFRRGTPKEERQARGETTATTKHKSVNQLRRELPRQLAQAQAALAAAESSVEQVQAQLQADQAATAASQAELVAATAAVAQVQAQLQADQASVEAARAAQAQAEAAVTQAQARLQDSQTQAEALAAEYERTQLALEGAQAQVDRLRTVLAKTQAQAKAVAERQHPGQTFEVVTGRGPLGIGKRTEPARLYTAEELDAYGRTVAFGAAREILAKEKSVEVREEALRREIAAIRKREQSVAVREAEAQHAVDLRSGALDAFARRALAKHPGLAGADHLDQVEAWVDRGHDLAEIRAAVAGTAVEAMVQRACDQVQQRLDAEAEQQAEQAQEWDGPEL